MSIDRWMDKEDVEYIYNGILLSHKKENNIFISSFIQIKSIKIKIFEMFITTTDIIIHYM